MPQKNKPLVQVKSFFESQEEIDQKINIFLISQKLSRKNFDDEWTVCEWKGRVYCLVRIYYGIEDLENKNPA